MKKAILGLFFIILILITAVCANAAADYSLSEIAISETENACFADVNLLPSPSAANVTVVGGMYKDKLLLETDISEITVIPEEEIPVTFEFKKQKYDEIKVFVLSDLSSVEPLSLVASAKPAENGEADLEKFRILSSLDMLLSYEDGTFRPENSMLRSEFLATLVRTAGYESCAIEMDKTDTPYSDVTSAHWACGYVNAAVELGILKGTEGTFRPNDKVTYIEAVKYIVSLLGYGDLCSGTDVSYIEKAKAIGLSTDDSNVFSAPASRRVIADLLFSALEIPMMEKSGTDYIIPENYKTLLTEAGFVRLEGIAISQNFSGNREVNFRVGSVAPKNNSSFTENTVASLLHDINVSPKLHMKSTVYVDIKGDKPKILYFAPTDENIILKISGEQTKGGTYSSGSLGYFKESAETTPELCYAALSPSCKVYINYNSETTYYFAANYPRGRYPEVLLIDNDRESEGYDVIIAKEYSSGVISDIIGSLVYKVYFDAYAGTGPAFVSLNPNATDYTFSISDEEGNSMDFEELKTDDVLNIFTSKDSSGMVYKEIIVTREKITGTVTGDAGGGYYYIDGKKYYSIYDLTVEEKCTFFADMYGKILDFEAAGAETEWNFGVLYASYMFADGIDDEPKAVIYTSDGKLTTYGFHKNICVNGNGTQTSTSISKSDISAEDNFAAIGGKNQKIVMYTVNSLGLISELYYGDGISLRDERYEIVSNTGASYDETTGELGQIPVEEGFTFVTLADSAWQTTLNSDKFNIATDDILINAQTFDYEMVVNIKEGNSAVFGVLFGIKAKPDASSSVMFVTVTGSSEDSEGLPATRITGYVNNERVSVLVNADTVYYAKNNTTVSGSAASITKGALIQYNGAEEADAVRILATASDVAGWTADEGAWIDSSEREDDYENGFLYVGSLDEYKRNTAVFNDGAEFYISTAVPTAVARNIYSGTVGNVYVNDYIGFGIAETDKMTYEDYSNGDIVAVYFFDGDAVAAMILDKDGDTVWN